MKHRDSSYLIVFVTILLFSSCNTVKDLNKSIQKINPPNCVLVNDGFFVDRTEISNINYREYLIWLKNRFTDQNIYKNALPDTTVWQQLGTEFGIFYDDYFIDVHFDNAPVVGIDYEQAVNFTRWRSDRVMEQYLIFHKLIHPQPFAKDNENFSIKKYYEELIHSFAAQYQVWYYPNFELPSKYEWEIINSFQDSIFKKRNCPKHVYIKSKEDFINTFKKDKLPQNKNTCKVFKKCNFLKYATIIDFKGSICEWIQSGKMCGGGSFLQTLDHVEKASFYSVNGPKPWVGYRNVCRMKKWGE